MYILLGNNHLGNIFAEVITIKTLFSSAIPSTIANCRGEFRGLHLEPYMHHMLSLVYTFQKILKDAIVLDI